MRFEFVMLFHPFFLSNQRHDERHGRKLGDCFDIVGVDPFDVLHAVSLHFYYDIKTCRQIKLKLVF